MPKKSRREGLISKAVSKRVLDSNSIALRSYGYYKKTSDLIERTDYALGRKPNFKANTGSTLSSEVNLDAVCSTTAEEI